MWNTHLPVNEKPSPEIEQDPVDKPIELLYSAVRYEVQEFDLSNRNNRSMIVQQRPERTGLG